MDLRHCSALVDTDIAQLLRTIPGLEEIFLGKCKAVTDESLKLIARHFSQESEGPELTAAARRIEDSGTISY